MNCEICNRDEAKLFLKVTQKQTDRLHIQKAHTCPECAEIMAGADHAYSVTVEEISQSEFNELQTT